MLVSRPPFSPNFGGIILFWVKAPLPWTAPLSGKPTERVGFSLGLFPGVGRGITSFIHSSPHNYLSDTCVRPALGSRQQAAAVSLGRPQPGSRGHQQTQHEAKHSVSVCSNCCGEHQAEGGPGEVVRGGLVPEGERA